MADLRKKQLAFNIVEFLRTSAQDGSVKDEDKESLEVAEQAIAEAFGVDPDSADDKAAYSMQPTSLLGLLDVFAKTRSKSAPAAGAAASASATPAAAAAPSGPSAQDKAKAEAIKVAGNQLMGKKDYEGAIAKYTEAIAIEANPVFYSNRAAAWGAQDEHEQAAEDAQRAIELDPKFAKAYSRLGHAQYSLGEYQKAVEAYEAGLKLDPSNASMKQTLGVCKNKLAEQNSTAVSDREPVAGGAGAGASGMPDLSSLASMLGGGGGGMPDIASMMRNPQMMAMAQQMMQNGGLDRLMQNPALRGMAENMQNGGGMPDFNALASDPAMRDLASQFMGGQGGQGN